MFPYIIVFTFTTLLAYAMGRSSYGDAGTFKRILLAICVCAPVVLLASFRDYTIGTDVLVYGRASFELACNCTFATFCELSIGDYGIGYIVYCWIVSNAFKSMPVFLGAIELLAIFPVVLSCFKLAAKYAWAGVLLFLLLFYGGTLNYLRQGIALGSVLISLCFLLERKNLLCLVTFLLAVSFHQTAVLAIPMYLLCAYYLMGFGPKANMPMKLKPIVNAVACLAAIAVVVFGRDLVLIFSSVKDSYVDQIWRLGTGGFSVAVMGILLMLVILVFAHQKSERCRESRISELLVLLFVVGFILRFLTIWQGQLERVALYYLACAALAIPVVAMNLERRDRVAFLFGTALFSTAYFYCYYVYFGYSEICPFVFNRLLF